jgi:hypothetical protein
MYIPESMIDGFLRIVRLIRHIDPKGVIIACAGGRASLYLANLSLLMGLHARIGGGSYVCHRGFVAHRRRSIKRWQVIFGKRQVVDNLSTNDKLRQPRNRKCPYQLIAKPEAPSGPWCKSAGEAFSASLLGINKGTQARCIFVEGLPVLSASSGKLARQHAMSYL